jgi:hypothetical protein
MAIVYLPLMFSPERRISAAGKSEWETGGNMKLRERMTENLSLGVAKSFQ